MHELGVLTQALKRVQRAADEKNIKSIKTVVLEIGETSSFVPAYFARLYPAARELFPATAQSELRMLMVPGPGLRIKEISY